MGAKLARRSHAIIIILTSSINLTPSSRLLATRAHETTCGVAVHPLRSHCIRDILHKQLRFQISIRKLAMALCLYHSAFTAYLVMPRLMPKKNGSSGLLFQSRGPEDVDFVRPVTLPCEVTCSKCYARPVNLLNTCRKLYGQNARSV